MANPEHLKIISKGVKACHLKVKYADWDDCPIEVLELKSTIQYLSG